MGRAQTGAACPTPTAQDDAYVRIKKMIMDGSVLPGQRLTERGLSEQLGVSRTPLREALLLLMSQGLLGRHRNSYWKATSLDERDVRDIFAARAQLDSLALRLAIDRASDSEVARLNLYLENSESAYGAGDLVAMTRHNGDFHTAIYAATHSQWLGLVSQPLRDQTIRIRLQIQVHVRDNVYPETHRHIYEALLTRDLQHCDAVARMHVEEDLNAALRHLSVIGGVDHSVPRHGVHLADFLWDT